MKMTPRNFGHTTQRGFRITTWGAKIPVSKAVANGRYEVFECGFSRGRYGTIEDATRVVLLHAGVAT